MKTADTRLKQLTFDDLEAWAGETILNRGKGYVENVGQVFRASDGAFTAWVAGGSEYATSVRVVDKRRYEYFCTCPYDDGPCKHAVAVILAAAARLKRQETLPSLDEDDELALALRGHDPDDIEVSPELESQVNRTRGRIEEILGNKSRDALSGLLLELADSYPEVRRHILENEQLAGGQVDTLVRSLRKEIRELTQEPAWYNPWRGEGHLPDYSRVEARLRALLARNHGDAVIELGEELWTRGNAQVEHSDDEGETAMALAACVEVVLEALPRSALSPTEQLLWVIDRLLEDEFSLLDSADKFLKKRGYTRHHWQVVVDRLEKRLEAMPKPRDFSARYRRGRLLDRLLDACARAGWKEKMIPLLEAEADPCQCYTRLVDTLIAAGEGDRAREWCIRGYERTIKEAPGLASALQDRLRQMAQKEKRHNLVATYRTQDFFSSPSRRSFTELRKAAEKAKCWPAVRAAVLRYLETGQAPGADGKPGASGDWPLPEPEVRPPEPGKRDRFRRFPDLDTLIDIAILEKRHDDVVELHGRRGKTRWRNPETDNAVAKAVAGTHPQVALAIWRSRVDSLIAEVKPKAYEQAAGYLRLMRKVYTENHRPAEWQGLLDELRRQHKAKRRLMEVLDNLSGRKIAG